MTSGAQATRRKARAKLRRRVLLVASEIATGIYRPFEAAYLVRELLRRGPSWFDLHEKRSPKHPPKGWRWRRPRRRAKP